MCNITWRENAAALKCINHQGNARARHLLSEHHHKGLRFPRIRLLQVCRDLHYPKHPRVPGAINNREGLRCANIWIKIYAEIPVGKAATDDSVSVHHLRIKFLFNSKIKERKYKIAFFVEIVPLPIDYTPSKEETKGLVAYKRMAATDVYSRLKRLVEIIKRVLKFEFLIKKKKMEIYDDDDETLDWWSKYFASLQVRRN